MTHRTTTQAVAAFRARRRAAGVRATETLLHESEIALLDQIKARLGLSSRSEVLRVMIAKMDPDTITPADVAKIEERAA